MSSVGYGRARCKVPGSEPFPDQTPDGNSDRAPNQNHAHSRGPLAELIHALNQPLTGLQCSMEVALASPRTNEQYAQGLRDGLVLTERMRELVQAIREVADLQGDDENKIDEESEPLELHSLLRGVIEDLTPVAAEKRLGVVLEFSGVCQAKIRVAPREATALVFRLLESIVSLARVGTELKLETGSVHARGWLRIQWQGEPDSSPLTRGEIAMLVAQAGWERLGAEWQRRRTDACEIVALSFRGPIGRVKAGAEEPLSKVISK